MKQIIFLIISLTIPIFGFSQNWVLKNSNTTDDIVNMVFDDESIGFFITNTGKIFKTTDSGENWTLFHDATFAGNLLYIVCANDSIIAYKNINYTGNDRCLRTKSPISFSNFESDTLDYNVTNPKFWNNEIWSVEKVNQSMGFANSIEDYTIYENYISASGATHIHYSDNFGTTWTTKQFTTSPLSSAPYQSFYTGTDILIAVTQYPTTIYQSFDNGVNWQLYQPLQNGLNLHFISPNRILANYLFGNSKVYYSDDGGLSFNEENLSDTTIGLYFKNNDMGFCFGSNGMLYKTTNGGGLLSINENPQTKKKIIIFPNPSENFINLENQTNLTITSIDIIDNLGKVLFKPSVNTKKIDVSTLPIGIYYIRLIFSTKENYTHKFIKAQ